MDYLIQPYKLIQEHRPHVKSLRAPDGSVEIWKSPHVAISDDQTKELMQELVTGRLFAEAKISGPIDIDFLDLTPYVVRHGNSQYPYNWDLIQSQPNIKLINENKIPLAFVVDWITGQTDRARGSTDNVRLQKSETPESYLFDVFDNGNCFPDPENPENNTDNNYASNLLFSTRVFSREELEKAIDEACGWRIEIIVEEEIDRLKVLSKWSNERLQLIIKYKIQIISYLNYRICIAKEKLLQWYDTIHQPPASRENDQQAVAA